MNLVSTSHEKLISWYSWTLNSLVNGVYAFGFLFMLPQLFVNYKLKSVAALPWRAFMYKAFNTFIDDIFAFIITMPTAHRIACFRDDIVFLIYLVSIKLSSHANVPNAFWIWLINQFLCYFWFILVPAMVISGRQESRGWWHWWIHWNRCHWESWSIQFEEE